MPVLTASDGVIAEAGRHLRSGGLVGMPTETVYGLAGDATNARAVASIYELKNRPGFNPLIIHVSDLAMAERYARFDRRAQFIAKRLWPGPLTLVLPKVKGGVADIVTAGLDTVAIRVPDHSVALRLIMAAGVPVAAPSANISGQLSPTEAAHVDAAFGRTLAMVLDGGPCRVGLESTVLDLSSDMPTLLRPGGISLDVLSASLGEIAVAGSTDAAPKSPGQLASHYAPQLPLRLGTKDPRPGEVLLAFGDVTEGMAERFAQVFNLSPEGDLSEAAARLFGTLHEIDAATHFSGIAVMDIPNRGLGIAINDRLKRAAAASLPER